MTKGVRNYQFSSSVDIAPQSESGTFGANLEFPKGIPWRRSSARTTSMDDLGFSMPNGSENPSKIRTGNETVIRGLLPFISSGVSISSASSSETSSVSSACRHFYKKR